MRSLVRKGGVSLSCAPTDNLFGGYTIFFYLLQAVKVGRSSLSHYTYHYINSAGLKTETMTD